MPEKLQAAAIQPHLKTGWLGRQIYLFESVDTTQGRLKKMIQQGAPAGSVVFSEFQTEGRGRWGRSWQAPAGSSLLFSQYWPPEILGSSWTIATQLTAVAIAGAMKSVCGIQVDIVWPNDIYYQGRKLAGILTECAHQGSRVKYLLVGCGINVHQQAIQLSNIQSKKAVSLDLITGNAVPRSQLAASVLNGCEFWLSVVKEEGVSRIINAWEAACPMLDRKICVRVDQKKIEGRMTGINCQGHLKMVCQGREIMLTDAEVLEAGYASLH